MSEDEQPGVVPPGVVPPGALPPGALPPGALAPRALAPRALRWALRAHPKASRAAHAPELEAIFAEATRGAGRLAVLREALDVAGHGLRQRLALDGAGRSATILGRAAPLAAAAYASSSLAYLFSLLPAWSWLSFGRGIDPVELILADEIIATMLWLAVLSLVLANRWGLARAVAVLGTLLQLPLVLAALPGLAGLWSHATTVALVPSVALCLLLLAPPRDLLGSARRDGRLIAGVFVLGLLPWGYEQLGAATLHEVFNPEVLELLLWSLLLLGTLPFLRRRGGAAAALALASLVVLIRYIAALIANLVPGHGLAFAALATMAPALGWIGSRAARRAGNS